MVSNVLPLAPVISETLARQLDALRSQLTPAHVGASLCCWWSRIDLPDGLQDTRARSLNAWQAVMDALRQAELVAGLVPGVSQLKRLTASIRHDGPLPVAMARYRVACPTPEAVAAVSQAIAEGGALPEPLPPLADLLQIREVFTTGVPMHDQWELAIPVVRARILVWSFDQRFWCAEPGAPLPDALSFDAGDGQGARDVAFGQTLTTTHPSGDIVTYTVTARWGEEVRTARGTVAIGGQPAPLPDETWQLSPPGAPAGHAFVYHPHASNGGEQLAKPVILSEGFPGGWACDYLYEMANQHGLLERLRAAGHSVILLGYEDGTIHIPANARVVVACLQTITARCGDPVCVGGVSMGGQVTRYALAWLESRGLPHPCQLYFSIDTPHLGSTSSVAVQWFVRQFAHVLPSARDWATLINTPANREFLIAFLESDRVRADPAHQALFADFAAVGNFPRQPRRIAVSSGHGRGGRFLEPASLALTWRDHPFAEATLRVSGPDHEPPVAEGACYPPSTSPTAVSYVDPESWEGVPGGQSAYAAVVGGLAHGAAYGTVTVHAPNACIVPTVSALYLRQEPHLPVPATPPPDSPFQAWMTADDNLIHCGLSANTAEFLFQEMTSTSTSFSRQP